tara:strand:- start:18536 stop:19234 length:699 start_codon:yes stop_codon:yes gene_type:complete
MEVHEQFYEDSKLQGKKREEAIKTYIELRQKSNLGSYLCFHLSDAEWTEIQPFLDEITKAVELIRDEKRMAWYEDENNWNDYDPTYLIHLSEQIEETKWMVGFFQRCTKAVDKSDYYTTFAIPDACKIRTGRMEDYDHGPGYSQFKQNNPEYGFELYCPKDGNIVVDFNWNHDGTSPVEIFGIEFFGRLMGENEEIPSSSEKTLSDLAEGFEDLDYDLGTWLSGKELIIREE